MDFWGFGLGLLHEFCVFAVRIIKMILWCMWLGLLRGICSVCAYDDIHFYVFAVRMIVWLHVLGSAIEREKSAD